MSSLWLFYRKSRQDYSDEPSIPPPPELPANEKAPWINIPSSSFSEDWGKLVNSPDHSDVVFELDAVSYHAHAYVLCSASDVFRMLLGVSLPREGSKKSRSLPQCSSGWSQQRLSKVARERERGREMAGILSVRER